MKNIFLSFAIFFALCATDGICQDGYYWSRERQEEQNRLWAQMQQERQQELQRQQEQQRQQQQQMEQMRQQEQMRMQQQQELMRQQQEFARQQQQAGSSAERVRLQAEQDRIRREMADLQRQRNSTDQQVEQHRQQYLSDLINTRDRVIPQEYNKLLQRLALNVQMKAHFRALRTELLSDTFWYGSDLAFVTGVLAINVNAVANLIQDLVVESPGLNYTREIVDGMLVSGQFDAAEALDVIREGVILDKLFTGNKLLQLGNNFTAFGYRLSRNINIGTDHTALKQEIADQLKAIDDQIEKYEREINRSRRALDAKEMVLKSLEAYLKLNGRK